MRPDRHTATIDAAAAWDRAHFPGYEPATPSPRDLIPADECAPGEPGPFADAFRKSVAEVRRVRGEVA